MANSSWNCRVDNSRSDCPPLAKRDWRKRLYLFLPYLLNLFLTGIFVRRCVYFVTFLSTSLLFAGCSPVADLAIIPIEVLAHRSDLIYPARVWADNRSYTDERTPFVRAFQDRFSEPMAFDSKSTDAEKLMKIYGIPSYEGPYLKSRAAGLSPSETLAYRAFGHAACFISKDDYEDKTAAFNRCADELESVLEKSFNNEKWLAPSVIEGEISLPSGKTISRAEIYDGAAAWVAEGYSPVDMGGYPSYIVSIRIVFHSASKSGEHFSAANIEPGLMANKPKNMVFMLPNKVGSGNNEYGDPIGVY